MDSPTNPKQNTYNRGLNCFTKYLRTMNPTTFYLQALTETYEHGMEEGRLQQVFERIENKKCVGSKPIIPPFSFPIITDRLRGKLSSEKVED